jgi:uncharacterized protein YceK
MQGRIWLLAALMLFIFSGCSTVSYSSKGKPETASTVEQRRTMMVGKWYGVAPTKESDQQ